MGGTVEGKKEEALEAKGTETEATEGRTAGAETKPVEPPETGSEGEGASFSASNLDLDQGSVGANAGVQFLQRLIDEVIRTAQA